MAYVETPELPEPKALPNLLVGAASPLWAYFGAAAAGGVAFWWMTRWAQPVNVEALFAVASPVAEPMAQATEALAEIPAAAVEATAELAVEAAPSPEPVAETAPALAAASDPAPEPDPEPSLVTLAELAPVAPIEAAPEPRVEAAPEPVAEAAPEPEAAKPRVRRAAPSDDASGVQH